MKKKTLITGVSGMMGALMSKKLLDLGHDVYGMVRPASARDYWRLEELGVSNHPGLRLVEGDLTDYTSMERLVKTIKPDYLFNFAAQSHVKISFEHPILTAESTGLGVLRLLEAIRENGLQNKTRLIQSSSSECFGGTEHARPDGFLDETCRMDSHSPYSSSKIFAHNCVRNYRNSYGIFASTYIGFNHENRLRSENFLTRKVSRSVARIKYGLQTELKLGNLSSKRDILMADDVIEGAWLIANHDKPDDFVLASGETHTMLEFVEKAFSHVGLNYNDYVTTDTSLFRPHEVDVLLGDASKAKRELAWYPTFTFDQLISEMVDADMERVKKELGKI